MHIPPFNQWPEEVRRWVVEFLDKHAGDSAYLNTTWLLDPDLLAKEFLDLCKEGLSEGRATRRLAEKYEKDPERMRKKLVGAGVRGKTRRKR